MGIRIAIPPMPPVAGGLSERRRLEASAVRMLVRFVHRGAESKVRMSDRCRYVAAVRAEPEQLGWRW